MNLDLPTTLPEIVEMLRRDQSAWLRLSQEQRDDVLRRCKDAESS